MDGADAKSCLFFAPIAIVILSSDSSSHTTYGAIADMGIFAQLPGREAVFIASWKGFRAFTDALEELGEEQFPTILAQLPDGEEGMTSVENVVLMLAELEAFEAQQHRVRQAVLVDSEQNVDVSMGSNVLNGTLTTNRLTGFDIGFNENGFFVRDRWELGRLLFQAMRVEQRLLHPETLQVEYVNLDTEQTFQCTTPFGKTSIDENGIPRMYLRHFHIEVREAGPERFLYITSPLKRVLEASIALQEPITWV